MKKTLRIASIASEVAPYSKTGGLADVAKALPKTLAGRGHEIIILTPYYSFIKKQGLPLKNLEITGEPLSVTVGKQQFALYFKELYVSPTLRVIFVGNEELFGKHSRIYGYPNDNLRFMVFDLASLALLEYLQFKPHIIHCHDWQSGLIPNFLKMHPEAYPSLKDSATLFTIHNLAHQLGTDWWLIPGEKRDDGKNSPPVNNEEKIKHINFTKRGITFADIINTVSERYAQEITTPEFGQDLDRYLRRRQKDVFGIINGIDYTVYNPAFDRNIKYRYDWNSLRRKRKNKLLLQRKLGLEEGEDIPLMGAVNRLSEQKGFNLIMDLIDTLVHLRLQVVIVGSGNKDYIHFFKKAAKKHHRKIGIFTPFSEEMAAKVYAGSDMFLMPSRFEPCGLSQLISLRYGSVPIVRETGGLSETVSNFNPKTRKGNGFVFKSYTKEDFLVALARALENYKYPQVWEFLTWNGMRQSYSWDLPATKYLKLYDIALKKKMGHR
jgi:starch synthase